VLLPSAAIAAAHAQGGPPFITDDPGTPGNHHWEINFGWIGNHNPGQSYYEIPDVDINYGWGDRIQLKYELPLAAGTDAAEERDSGWVNRSSASKCGPMSTTPLASRRPTRT
jgi:hypothetical protein